ncbi:hypothetical protein Tph_c14670 [Thermacetogenium phaeum DSM 12270]|uniref:Uncharacterized protein n=1 Tax=Thermacetogenium phaeum (strain ATCC BAA-254 / DSM 26808 / PB) TaxID=1089553 RepID=K4LF67_THEPS|nr:hypothetical protein [Thermacetogenium phaeum]AFV11676.1 hypothetical protein Tph_c14670 [Thermacetogenium phaeum DSM 12270]
MFDKLGGQCYQRNILALSVIVVFLFSVLFPVTGTFASDTSSVKVIFLSEKVEKVQEKGIDILSATPDKWNELDKISGDVIWVKGNVTLQNDANRIYLRKKLDEGARIYFIKKGISVEDMFSYLGIKDYKIQTTEGASPDPADGMKSNLSSEVTGIQRIDRVYGIFALRFQNPTPALVMESLAKDSQKDFIKLFRSSESKDFVIQAIDDWPIAFISSVTDYYTQGTVSFSYKLSAHPTNPINYKYYYVGHEIVEVTANYSQEENWASIDYFYPCISAGNNGTVYDYSPSSTTTSGLSITVTLPYNVGWTFPVGAPGSGLQLSMSKYSGGIGGTWVKWCAEAVDLLGRHCYCVKTLRAEPRMEFYVNSSEANVRAYSSYTVDFRNNYSGSVVSYFNSFDAWVPQM